MFRFRSEKIKVTFLGYFQHCFIFTSDVIVGHHYHFTALFHSPKDFPRISTLLLVSRRTWMCKSSQTPPLTLMFSNHNTDNRSNSSTCMPCVRFWSIIWDYKYESSFLLSSSLSTPSFQLLTYKNLYLLFATKKNTNLNNGSKNSNSKAWYWQESPWIHNFTRTKCWREVFRTWTTIIKRENLQLGEPGTHFFFSIW